MNKVWKNILSLALGFGITTSLTLSFATLDQTSLLKEKDQSVAVFELQHALNELGYFHTTEFTNVYGKQTLEAVKAFQRSLKMTPDGVSGKVTLRAIRDHQLNLRRINTLSAGDTGARVVLLKSDLKTLGLFKGNTSNNVMDADTVKALKAFQTSVGLKADGVAGDTTLEALTKKCAEKKGYAVVTKSAAKTSTTSAKSFTTAKAAPVKTTTTATAKAAKTTTTSRGSAAVRLSQDFLGVGYKWGGSSGSGFDCSGFTVYVMKQFGVSLPHSASAQYQHGTAVKKESLKEGDLVFFNTDEDSKIDHVGIYLGNGQFIHASSAKNKVIVSSLKTYGGKYIGAKRVL